MPTSAYLQDALADWFYNGVAYVPPANVYIALHTGDPGETASPDPHEVDGLNYARLPVAQGSGWGAPAGGLVTTTGALTWPVAGDAWGLITHLSEWDALEDGNMLRYGPVPGTPQDIGIGDVFRIGAGNLAAGWT